MHDAYRRIARFYDTVVGRPSEGLRRGALGRVSLRQGMSVLEVGCGTGSNLVAFHREGCRVAGVDTSPAMLEEARRKLGATADLRVADAADLPYEAGAFDLVVAFLTLHEMPPEIREAAVGEMVRVLAPHGRLLLVDHHAGRVPFPKGWLSRALIIALEIGAGWDHFRQFRDFLRRGGLPGLIDGRPLEIVDGELRSSGTMVVWLARRT